MEGAKAEAVLFKTTVGILSGPEALEQSSSSNNVVTSVVETSIKFNVSVNKGLLSTTEGKYMSRDQSRQIGKNEEMFQLSHNQCCIPCLHKQWCQE